MKNVNLIQGDYSAKGLKFCIIASRFNNFITDRLVEGAVDAILRHSGEEENIDIVKVPGSFEIPLVAKKVASTKKYDAVVALGAVIRGDTPHFDYIAGEVAKGVALVTIETGVPVIFGVLTTDDVNQAVERAGTKLGNKGFSSAMNAIEMANLMKKISKS